MESTERFRLLEQRVSDLEKLASGSAASPNVYRINFLKGQFQGDGHALISARNPEEATSILWGLMAANFPDTNLKELLRDPVADGWWTIQEMLGILDSN